jgi:[NiFe] hydrogenase assembly HybE family chaperone
MTEVASLSARIETVFTEIARTRMAGIPVMNPALAVAMRGLHRFGGYWTGILVTPWFMNLVMLPVEPDGAARRVGDKTGLSLPSGRYEGIWGYEEGIGDYWSCSLFSPMFEFADQETAVATADTALAALMTPAGVPQRAEVHMAMIWNGDTAAPEPRAPEPGAAAPAPSAALSRRALFGLRPDEGAEA